MTTSSDRPRRLSACPALALVTVVLLGIQGRADLVTLADGRTFEGQVLQESAATVRIDTMVEGTRVVLSFPRVNVKSVEAKAIPERFFERAPAEARVSDSRRVKDPGSLFLEVPIIGDLGRQVFARALSPVLAYAKRWAIPHIVFVIDSRGGSRDEMREIYLLLKEYSGDLRYHAIVKKCQAEAMAVVFWCMPVLIIPGGVVGGGPGPQPALDDEEGTLQGIMWSQVAEMVVSDTKVTGHMASVVRALVDPGHELAAWKDEDGNIAIDSAPPPGVAIDRIIFQIGDGEILVIDRKTALELGMPDFQGGAADLGKILKIPGWAPESEYGIATMRRVGAEMERKIKAREAEYERKVKQVATRRQSVQEFIRTSLGQAASWDPQKATYSTYSEAYNMGAGWWGGWTSNRWTPESQKKWKSRTDATMYYLREAVKGLKSMKKIEAEAASVGLEPFYQPGQIDLLVRDLDVRYQALAKNRDKAQE